MLQEKQIESDVVGALKNGDIVPYIQPKVYMDTGEIVGGEALARWKYQGGLMRPDRFIPVIERNGMIIEVDRCIWEQVFRYQRKVMDEGRTPVPISINVSRMHIYDKNHMNDVLYGLRDKYRVPVEYIPLELTESAFAPGEDEIQGRMQKLREQGFIISMDDFGSGYSSLNMLKARELDEIKVDKEFMGDLDREKSRIVLKHLLAMLHELNVDIIVEGVETEAQRDFLLENNCRRAQGFLYYRPMPLDDFDALMKSGA